MRDGIAVWIIVWTFGCSSGANQLGGSDHRASQASAVVRVDVASETEVFQLHAKTGKLVRRGIASAIGVPAGNGNTALEYLSEDEHWVWVHSVEAPMFVRRTALVKEPYPDNPSHIYLKEHSSREFAQEGLPYWKAEALGSCPEYRFAPSGRLERVSVTLLNDNSFAGDESAFAKDVGFATSIDDYVLGESLALTSNHCLGPHQRFSARFQRLEDIPERDAYVLGAGWLPLIKEQGIFLMMLAQQYRTVYINDIQHETLYTLDQNRVDSEYYDHCPSGTASGELDNNYSGSMENFCDIVKEPPTNIDFRYMNMPAAHLPTLNDVDVFVIFPDPGWVYGTLPRLRSDVYSLGEDLVHLLGEASVAYVVTEMSFHDRRFEREGLDIVEHTRVFDEIYTDDPDNITRVVVLSTLSMRQVLVSSLLMEYVPSEAIDVYQVSRKDTETGQN